MKKLLGIVISLTLNSAAFAQVIEFKTKDNTIDYGTVARGSDSGIRTFEFKNTGNASLIITNVLSSCGCAVPSSPDWPVMPGQTSKIDVRYNMAIGRLTKTVTVLTNARNAPAGSVELRIKGNVVKGG